MVVCGLVYNFGTPKKKIVEKDFLVQKRERTNHTVLQDSLVLQALIFTHITGLSGECRPYSYRS